KPCFLFASEPFHYLAERLNPCHGNLCDNPLPLSTTRFPKSFRKAFFAIWVVGLTASRISNSLIPKPLPEVITKETRRPSQKRPEDHHKRDQKTITKESPD
ncbi:hypothetical protein AVEN_86980-1, partial [Araneus ventricosus]